MYSNGDSFDPAGLVVYATWSGESEDTTTNVASLLVWTPDPLTTGTTSVTGTYPNTDKTVTVNGLTVNAITSVKFDDTKDKGTSPL